jgi:hypothetical protein
MLSTLILSVKHHGGKSTALKGDMQGGGDFLSGGDVQMVFERYINTRRKGKRHSRQREETRADKRNNKTPR